MANQIIIDIGAAANDGTGDPLRTAFNYVNNNFSNVWNTGLPTSNVQFLDNKILTVNTNANLVLAPNGIGKVASNVDIVPNTANVFNLGSSTRRWNTVYGQYLNLSHNATIGGNLVVTGNLSAGNLSYTGNVFVGDLEGSVLDGASSLVLDVITSSIYVDNYYYANCTPVTFGGGNSTPGGSNTQMQFNDGGVFGGAANFTFNKNTNILTVPGNLIPTGNTVANLGAFSNRWDTIYTKNITANSVSAVNATLSGDLSANNVSVGNITSSDSVYSNTATFYGDQFSDGALYVGDPAGTVLGSDVVIQVTANAGGYSQTNFQNINSGPTASSDYILTADNGNDTTHYLDMGITSSGWDGSETNVLAGLVANNGYLYVQDGNLSLGVRNGSTSYKWNFDTTGLLTVPGNIIPTGNNTQSLGSATRQWKDLWVSNNTIYINSVPISLAAGNVLTVNGQDVVTTNSESIANIGNLQVNGTTIALVSGASQTQIEISPNGESWAYLQIPNDATGNVANVRMHNDAGNIEIAAGDTTHGGSAHYWYFGNNGNLTLPVDTGNINNALLVSSASNGFTSLRGIDSGGNTRGRVTVTGTDGETQTVTVGTYNANTDTQYDWAFDDGGSFTLSTGNVYFTSSVNNPVIVPDSLGVTIDANRTDPGVDYISVTQSGINLFSVNSINITNDTTGLTNSDINLRAGDDILLQGRNRPADEEREGGDLFIYGGNGSDASSNGFDAGGGGDLLIEAGLGGNGTGTGANGGAGGQIGINAGNGGTTVDALAGSGGSISITAGSAATPADPASGGWGGSITIQAGETTRLNENGGSITLATGASTGLGYGAAGAVEINIATSNVGPGGTWTFTGTGTTLQVPPNSEIYGANFGNFTVGCAGNTFITSSDYGANVKNWTFGYTGTLSLPGISTGTGTGEIADIRGTRTSIGVTNDANYGYAATFTGTTPALAYTASSNLVQSAKVTFVVQSNNATFGWEQFDVSVIKLQAGGVGVTVSNRMNNNPANGDTQVTADVNIGGIIEIYLAQPGAGTAYVNYTSTEFNLMID